MNEETEQREGAKVQPLTRLSSRELFSKTFDEVLTVAPPVLSNAREFFTQKLKFALPDHVSTDEGFRTYCIFCELLRNEGGTTTPRQVVAFVNDLSGLFVLQKGRFRLPTIAAYLAHQDLLTSDPTRLNQEASLDAKIVSLAGDPHLARNLAAMVFNVDAELAFQILLDGEIAEAAVADDPNELTKLASASGFDLRVDDVVRSHLDEWQSTGDYGIAIQNFASLLKSYDGDARLHIAAALVDGFEKIGVFALNSDEYAPYLTLFELARDENRPLLLRRFLRSAFAGLSKVEKPSFSTGSDFAAFLKTTRESVEVFDLGDVLREQLGNYTPISTADFVFGLGTNIADAGFGFNDFEEIEIELPEDTDHLTGMATKYPEFARAALAQFNQVELLTDITQVTFGLVRIVAQCRQQWKKLLSAAI